jgi:hypothetical protein
MRMTNIEVATHVEFLEAEIKRSREAGESCPNIGEDFEAAVFDLRDARKRIASLEDMLTRAADTFRDMKRVSFALGRTVLADACDVAERGCRDELAAAELEPPPVAWPTDILGPPKESKP